MLKGWHLNYFPQGLSPEGGGLRSIFIPFFQALGIAVVLDIGLLLYTPLNSPLFTVTPRMSISYVYLHAFWILASFFTPCLAQTSGLFFWGFTNGALSTSLPTCAPLPIFVKPHSNTTNGTPPYYMISLAVGGTPVTTLIGTDENNLSWTITQPVGSQLALLVVDANGSSGGLPAQIFNVIEGQTTQCVTAPLTPPFTVTANVTGDLTTCQPWGLTVKGGVPPYNVTLVQPDDPIVTNVTMPFGLDVFTFINRANPNARLIAAISDLTGRWATGTPIVNTQGAAVTDDSCLGLVTSSGNSTIIKQQEAAANAASQSARSRHAAVTAVAVTLVLLVLIGLAIATSVPMRRRRREAQAELAQAIPTQYIEPESKMLSINNNLDSSSNQPLSGKAALALREGRNSPSESSSIAALSYQTNGSATSTLTNSNIAQRPNNRISNSGFVNFPATSIRRSAKLAGASATSTRVPDSVNPGIGTVLIDAEGAPQTTTRVNEEVVFQHRDAGVVRELPPPYADRVRRSRPSSS